MYIFSRLRKSRAIRKRKKATVLFNVFNTSHSKTALLSYVKEIFEDERINIDKAHTNRYTTLCIAEIVSELGYNVDVINWQSSYTEDPGSYDLVLGLGRSLENILISKYRGSGPRTICFATGCNPTFSNKVTMQRVTDFYLKKGKVLLSSSRYIREDWPLQHSIADWIILHGDFFARKTYREYNFDSVLAPVYQFHCIEKDDNTWLGAKKNYLWFGSEGAIHKGLDLLIDTFKDLQEYNLHICCHLHREPEFFEIYKEVIEKSENIIYHGFVRLDSEVFKNILNICAFVIFPSVSEGNCAAVITCMANGGLIPVVTRNADIDLEQYGVEIMGFTENDILSAIERSQQLSLDELKSQTAKILHTTKNYHSFEHFREDFKNKLIKALKSPNFFEKMDAMDRTKNH